MTHEEALKVAKPILFNTEMVRAIQNGRKTVTRRIAFPNKDLREFKIKQYSNGWWYRGRAAKSWDNILACIKRENPCRYRIGDILYVRETWWRGVYGQYCYLANYDRPDLTKKQLRICKEHKCRPSIHMPREAARIFLRVTGVRMERLQDIDDDGVVAEGLEIGAPYDELWNSTIKKSDLDKYGWEVNPWVWVIEFERVEVTENVV